MKSQLLIRLAALGLWFSAAVAFAQPDQWAQDLAAIEKAVVDAPPVGERSADFNQQVEQRTAKLNAIEAELHRELTRLAESSAMRATLAGQATAADASAIEANRPLLDAIYLFRKVAWLHQMDRQMMALHASNGLSEANSKQLGKKLSSFGRNFTRIGRQSQSRSALLEFVSVLKTEHDVLAQRNEGNGFVVKSLRRAYAIARNMVRAVVRLPDTVKLASGSAQVIWNIFDWRWLTKKKYMGRAYGLGEVEKAYRPTGTTRGAHRALRARAKFRGVKYEVTGSDRAIRANQLPDKTIHFNMAPHTGGILDIEAMAHVPGAEDGTYIIRTKNFLKLFFKDPPMFLRRMLANNPDILSVSDRAAQPGALAEANDGAVVINELLKRIRSGTRIVNMFPAGYIAEPTGSGATNVLSPEMVNYWIKPLIEAGYRVQIAPVSTPNAEFFDGASVTGEGKTRRVIMGNLISADTVAKLAESPAGHKELAAMVQAAWLGQLAGEGKATYHNEKMMGGMMRLNHVNERLDRYLSPEIADQANLGGCTSP